MFDNSFSKCLKLLNVYEYEIEIFDGQLLSARLSSALLGLNSKILESASEEETQIAENITLKINEETPGQYILFDSEEEEEAIISAYTVSVLEYFKDSIPNLAENTPIHFSCDLILYWQIH